MCKPYGGEASVDLLRALLNLSNKGDSGIPKDMDFRSFMMEGIDGEFHFELDGGIGEGSSPSIRSVNNEAPMIDVNPLNSAPPSKVAENIDDSYDASLEKDVADEAKKVHKSSKATGKRNQYAESSGKETRHKLQKVPPQASKVVAHMTPPSWKQHLKEMSLKKLHDIHDRAYMQQVVLDNLLNNKTHKLISSLTQARSSCNAIRKREREKDKAYAKLEKKCNNALQDLDKNPLVLDMHAKIETLQGQGDKLHGAFDLEKMLGYLSSSKKEFDQANDNLATATYYFIAEATTNPYASVEELPSKKPKSLRTKHAPSYSKPSYSKVLTS
uniref:Uncharacterized protein n=1 Tax=Tanacetum cinerariifolium TaxID=118510 RepID=A0A699GK00_TANCI|nr:hypothetical protein [Tanacetum cinerariifolium]